MRIAVPTFGADRGRSGIGRYTREILAGLFGPKRVRNDVEGDVFVSAEDRDTWIGPGHRGRAIEVTKRTETPLWSIFWHQTGFPSRIHRGDYDLAFFPAGNRRLSWNCAVPTVASVHDLTVLRHAHKYGGRQSLYIGRILPKLIRRLTRVVTLSEASRQDITRFTGYPLDRIDVIPLAADTERYHDKRDESAADRLAERYGIARPYVLYVSRLEHPAKNHVRLLRAFDRFVERTGSDATLVLVGPDWTRAEEIHEAARRVRHPERIVRPGFVDEADLPDLYREADAFVFPSLCEGFGLPILEAMACGVPVACSNVSSMPEVAGDAAHLFDPEDEDAIADAIERLVTDAEARRDLRARGLERAALFSWARTARETLASMERAMETAS